MKRLRFPEGFLWGTSTAAYQVEGRNKKSDWWHWEQVPGRVRETSGLASNHYRLFKEDFEIAKHLGHNAHRFSIEWSRIEPEPGRWDEEEIAHYKEVINTLKGYGIEPLVTLIHCTLPLWVADMGGFENRGVVDLFERYALKVAHEYGKDVKWWITIGEPVVCLYMGYIERVWSPGKDIGIGIVGVLRNMMEAHAAGYRAIHRAYESLEGKKPMVGLTKYIRIFRPYRRHFLPDMLAASLRDRVFNRLIIDALSEGLPFLPHLRRTLDFIGLDYYTRELTRFAPLKPFELFGESVPSPGAETSDMGWEIYPEGIYLALLKLKGYNLPIIVTENGLADAGDRRRGRFIVDHLLQIHRAIEEGVDVRGYLYWSLIDNFEWHEGFWPRFGLVEVDYTTQKRRIRPSAYLYARICSANQLILEGDDYVSSD